MVLGFFLDGISITVMSLPICLPLVITAGFDPIWFGVFLVAMTELAQITPPVGFNLFVLQGMTGYSIGKVAVAAAPFFILMVIGVAIITFFPISPFTCLSFCWVRGDKWTGTGIPGNPFAKGFPKPFPKPCGAISSKA